MRSKSSNRVKTQERDKFCQCSVFGTFWGRFGSVWPAWEELEGGVVGPGKLECTVCGARCILGSFWVDVGGMVSWRRKCLKHMHPKMVQPAPGLDPKWLNLHHLEEFLRWSSIPIDVH